MPTSPATCFRSDLYDHHNPTRRVGLLGALCTVLMLAATAISQDRDSLGQYREAASKYEKDIAAWEARDREETADASEILFLGSSSIRLWKTIGSDMAPWPSIGRGYGGAKFSDLAIFAPRLLAAHHPRAVAIYVGNDITGKPETDKTPEEIVRLFGIVVAAVKQQAPKADIFLIAITPAPSRFAAWPKIQAANLKLREYCEQDKQLHFIETHPAYLTADGQPRPELFVADRLHQNEDGYRTWSGILRKEFERVLGSPQRATSAK